MKGKLTGIAKRFFLIFIPLLALTTAITAGFLLQELKSQRRILLAGEHRAVELLRRVAVNDIKSILTDLLFLTTHSNLRQMLENDQPAYHPELSKIFLDFCKRKAIYDQIRFLDETGMERIRINFGQGRPYVVADDELQNKAKRYYFADTFKLEPGQVFVSPMDLNIEHGRIEQPLKPKIRFTIGWAEAGILDDQSATDVVNHLGKETFGAGEPPRDALTPEALAELPGDLPAELKQAATDLDVDLIQVIIERTRELNAPVGDGLANLARDFQYDKLLALIQRSDNRMDTDFTILNDL